MVHLRPHTSNSSVAKRDLTGPGASGALTGKPAVSLI